MQPYIILLELLSIRDSLLRAATLSFDLVTQPTFGFELRWAAWDLSWLLPD